MFRWQCDRRYTHRCYVSLTASTEGEILKEPTSVHKHDADFERRQRFQLKRKFVEKGTDHMKVAPVKLINEFLTAETFTLRLSSTNLSARHILFS